MELSRPADGLDHSRSPLCCKSKPKDSHRRLGRTIASSKEARERSMGMS